VVSIFSERPYDPRMSVLDRIVAAALPLTPKAVVGRVAKRYIAGETIGDAVRVISELNAKGAQATVDVLGEFITDVSEARATAAEYARVLDAIAKHRLRANISVKLTAFGLGLDERVCRELVTDLATKAAAQGRFVRIDMENSPYTDRTLALVRELHARGLPVGAVLQAYLRRTDRDAAELAGEGISVRLCKGIYRESEEIAYQGREEIRESYRRNLRRLLEGRGRVAIATHDDVLVAHAQGLLAELSVPGERVEFQMLLGVRERLRDDVIAKGHAMRVYVPYGAAWYGYSVRRLRENPSLAGNVFKAMFSSG
jgi:proline dehydrogenase